MARFIAQFDHSQVVLRSAKQGGTASGKNLYDEAIAPWIASIRTVRAPGLIAPLQRDDCFAAGAVFAAPRQRGERFRRVAGLPRL